MRICRFLNFKQYLIAEYLDVIIFRIEWFEKMLETEQMSICA